MLARIGAALDSEIVALGAGPTHLRVDRADHALRRDRRQDLARTPASRCCAPRCSTAGRTTLRKVARIEEVNRLLEVLSSIGVHDPLARRRATTSRSSRPAELDLSAIDEAAARRTRSVIMFLGPLLHRAETFELPYAGGCNLGTRTVEPHMTALRPFGLEVKATDGFYHAHGQPRRSRRAARSCSPSAATPSPRTP